MHLVFQDRFQNWASTTCLHSKNLIFLHNSQWITFLTQLLVGWFGEFYGRSTFLGYLTPNPFLCK